MSTYQLTPVIYWEQIYSAHYRAAVVTSRKMVPIVPQEIPIQPEGHVLAVYAVSETGLDHWTAAGSLQQIYPALLFSDQKLMSGRYRIWLKQTTLLELPDRGSTYQLRYHIPRWLEDVRIVIWQYIGPRSPNERGNVSIILRNGQTTADPGGGYTTTYQFSTGFGSRNFSLIGIFELGLTDRKIEALEERLGVDAIRITISTINPPLDGHFSAILAIASPN